GGRSRHRARRARPGDPDVASRLCPHQDGVMRGGVDLCGCSPQDHGSAGSVTTMRTVLVVNAGSSSVKFQVFGIARDRDIQPLIRGEMEGIGVRPRLRARDASDGELVDKVFPVASVPDVPTAIRTAGAWLMDTQ